MKFKISKRKFEAANSCVFVPKERSVKRPKHTSSQRDLKEVSKEALDRAQELAEQGTFGQSLVLFKRAQNFYEQAVKQGDIDDEFQKFGSKIWEQQSQVLLELDRTYEAIKAAEKSIKLLPHPWYAPYQTLARAQRNHGEVSLAIASLEKALAIEDTSEIREELRSLRAVHDQMKEKGIRAFTEHFRAKEHIKNEESSQNKS